MRRHVITAGVVLLGLGALWRFWGVEEAVETLDRVAIPRAVSPEAPRAITTRIAAAPELPEEDADEEVEEVDLLARPWEEALMSAETHGKVWFFVETESGEPVEDWFVDSPDCGLTWSSQLADVPMLAPEGDCTFRAWRLDGMLKSRSDALSATIRPGEDLEVILAIPDERTGGLGVYIREHDLGIEVMGVMPRTPAHEMGLERGDLIVAVNGVDAVELELEDFVSSMTGPEGSEVDFALAYEGDTGMVVEDITLVRTYLEEDEETPKFDGARFAGRALEAIEGQDE